jgi:hypothetical protein
MPFPGYLYSGTITKRYLLTYTIVGLGSCVIVDRVD